MTAGDSVQLSRAGLMIELGRFADAARLLAAVLAESPDSCRGWCLLSRAHLGSGNPAQAITAASRASALDPANDWPFRLISTALTSLDRGTEAVEAAAEARRLAPHSWRSHVCLAQAAAVAGQFDLAAEAAQAGLAIAPDHADVHLTAGRVALSRGEVAEARRRQEAALALDPAHSGAINELGRISLHMRDPASAARHFIRAARASPGNDVFGRNSELVLGYLAIRLARTVALAAAVFVIVGTLVATGHLVPAAGLAMAEPPLLAWAAARIKAIPQRSRRHLTQILARQARLRWPRIVVASHRAAPAIRGPRNDKSPTTGTSTIAPAATSPLWSSGQSDRL